MTLFGLGVETEDEDELELGADVYSKSIHYGNAYDGGTIIRIVRDDEDRVVSVMCMAGWHDPSSPRLVTLDRSDLNMESVKWFGQNARRAADAIMSWISNSRRRPKDAGERARWTLIAAQLAEAGVGQYLPGAEKRYRQHRAQLDQPKPIHVVDATPEQVDSLHDEIQRRADLARQRMHPTEEAS